MLLAYAITLHEWAIMLSSMSTNSDDSKYPMRCAQRWTSSHCLQTPCMNPYKTTPPPSPSSCVQNDVLGITIIMPTLQCAFAGSPYRAPWWNCNMPAVHPFTLFMERIKVDLPKLYSDGSGKRAGSHALHALALLLELRRKFEGSTGCYYGCCIRPDRNAARGLPDTLMR